MIHQQFPYTDLHNLNLDWILHEIDNLKHEVEQIEDYGDRISDVENALTQVENSIRSIQGSLTSLNQRCNNIESSVEDAQEAIRNMYAQVAADIANIQNEVNAIRTQYIALKAYVDMRDRSVLDESKQFTLERIAALLDYFEDPEQVYVINPFTQEVQTIQQFIDSLAEYLRYGALTAEEFDSLGLTASDYDAMQIKALEYDMFGKYAIAFLHKAFITAGQLAETLEGYATKSELAEKADTELLANYATLANITVQNPVTGELGTLQSAIDSLANFHKNGLTAEEFDDLELTATQFDALSITAFNYDYYSKIILAQAGLITLLTGLTAQEYDSLYKDDTGRVFVTNLS